VNLIIAQRLARRLCKNCKRPIEVPKEALLKEGFTETEIDAGITVFEPVGCDQCNEGYKGRTGIYQVMPVSEAMGKIIMEGGNAIQIAAQADADGVPDLRRSGLTKVKRGDFGLAELNRITVE
jgi:type IV pilus assembly protein PilB